MLNPLAPVFPMSGHSKWNNIKIKKGASDAKRAKHFTQMARVITLAVKKGGKDPKFNFSLRLAIDRAKEFNVPKDNIERAIKKGTGELAGEEIVQNRYVGYGPGGVALVVGAVTDNPNRTVAELKHLFSMHDGNLGGSVAWQFENKGIIHIVGQAAKAQDDTWMLGAIEAGIEDAQASDQDLMVITPPNQLQAVKEWLESTGLKVESAQLSLIAKEHVPLANEEAKEKLQKFIEAIDEQEDVEKVYTNADM